MTTEPTDHELLMEALKVSNLPEAEALRVKYIKRRNHGIKSWKRFIKSVDAAHKVLNPDHPDVDIEPYPY